MHVAELTGVWKRYPSLDRPALNDVNLTIDAGTISVVVGANGSGKSTAMEILTGLRVPDAGQASICGRRVIPGGKHRYKVGVQLQDSGLPQRLRVGEAVRAVSSLYRDAGPVDSALGALGLEGQLNRMVDQLSGGWQRRLDIALACIGNPRLLVLDEPSSGLDPGARADLWQFLRTLRSQGTAILASTHDLTEAEGFADEVNVLHEGRVLLNGKLADVLARAGGDWRLRLLDAESRADEVVRELGHTPMRMGQHVVVIGDRPQIDALRASLLDRQTEDTLAFADVITGPVRLEDVFAFASASAGGRNS